MNRNLRRLLIAFTVSCACYFGTWFWYQKGKTASADNSNSKPIARLQSHINEVQRKPIARVIWENISKNETLFVGETIRTSANSEATISFLGTNTMIELEPDSMIALEEGQGSFALNFLKGNMFLRKKEGDVVTGEEQKELVVKVGNNKVNLSNAEVSLSKRGKGPVDLQVFSGQAKVDNQGKTVTLDKSTIGKLKEDSIEKDKVLIEIISPQANSEMYSEPSQLKNVTFTWKPIDDNYEMKLRWGHNRKSFNKQVTTSVAAKDGKITQSVRPGKLYWQLEAIPKDPNQASVKSPIYKNKIIPKKGTILLEPKNQEKLPLEKDDLVPFSWTHQMELVEPTLQISEDPQFKKVILTKNLEENESNFSFNIPEMEDIIGEFLVNYKITHRKVYLVK